MIITGLKNIEIFYIYGKIRSLNTPNTLIVSILHIY